MDPILAANIAMSLWQVLQGAADPEPEADSKHDALQAALERTGRDAAENRNADIQRRMDRLVLAVHAMWSLMAEKMGVTDAELVKRMAELDAADGTVDGRVLAPPVKCSCGAMVSRRLGRCLFCGKVHEGVSTFEKL